MASSVNLCISRRTGLLWRKLRAARPPAPEPVPAPAPAPAKVRERHESTGPERLRRRVLVPGMGFRAGGGVGTDRVAAADQRAARPPTRVTNAA